ncbi:cytochrome P450 [Exophiala viscosa]|uniref:cytochrome P450 n=1 Tax=Exophiala viscosa TaxID=2486360 RepID=UPI0021931A74|nr:cytochrome P450 [Exophiala viscosa]
MRKIRILYASSHRTDIQPTEAQQEILDDQLNQSVDDLSLANRYRMHIPVLTFVAATGLLIGILIWTVIQIIVDPRKLRRFPTPSLGSYTPFWLMYHSSRGQRYAAVDRAHQKLGPVVRISSNHISFTDPRAFKEIYNYGSSIVKDDFYEMIAAGNPSMAQTASKVEHAAKRRNLSHVFSGPQITSMEPRVMRVVDKLCKKLEAKCEGRQIGEDDKYPAIEGTFDLRPWLNMTSFDAITSMFWSNEYGFLDRGNDICSMQLASGDVRQTNAMNSYHSAVHFNAWLAHLPEDWYRFGRKLLKYTHGQMAGDYFSGMARYLVSERLRSNPPEPDLFSSLPVSPSEKRPLPMTFDQIHAECTTMLDAGNDTTQTSLTNCMYQLAKHPDKQRRLRDELYSGLPPTARPIASFADLQNIQYLRACLDESFRVRTPLGFGLPRKVVEPGVVISGHKISPGTTVSAPLYSLHLNEDLFHDAKSFIPERWLPCDEYTDSSFQTSPEERKNLKDYVLPFSLGSRACIGRNLAYMELSIVIAALIMSFDWELARPAEKMVTVERFNSNPKELFVRARRLEAA